MPGGAASHDGDLEHHRERRLHVGGTPSDDGVAVPAAGQTLPSGGTVSTWPANTTNGASTPPPRRTREQDGVLRSTTARPPGSAASDRARGSRPRRRSPKGCHQVERARRRAAHRARRRPGSPAGSRVDAASQAVEVDRPSKTRSAVPGRGGPRRSRPFDLERPAGEPDDRRPAGTSPASFAATATAHAPLPHAMVSPEPRSHTRALIPSSTHLRELHVGALGEQLVALERRPDVRDVEPIGVVLDEQRRDAGSPSTPRSPSPSCRRPRRTAAAGTSPTPDRAWGWPPS